MPNLLVRLALPALFGVLLAAAPAARGEDAPAAPATAAPAVASPAASPVASPVGDRAAATEHPAVMLEVMNRDVMLFRATLLGLTPRERVDAAAERIASILEAGGPGQVAFADVGGNTAITLDGKFAFFVTDADANPLLDQDRAALARAAATTLELVAREHDEAEQQPRPFAVAFAVGVTVLWLALLWLIGVVRRHVQVRFAERAALHAEAISVGGARLFDRWTVSRIFGRVLGAISLLVAFLLTYEWLGLVLQAFPYTRPWGEHLTEFLIDLARNILVATAEAAPGLFIVVVIFFAARAVIGFAAGFFGRVQRGAVEVQWMDAHTAAPTQRLFTAFIWLFALAMAYPYLPGSGSQAFQGLSVLVGLMFSLGGASSIGQAVSGLIVMYTGTLKLGEYVRIGDQEGTVTELGAFQTRLRTGMGQELVLPNSMVVGSVVCNYSRAVKGKGFVVDAVVTIGYDAPWRQVHALLTQAAVATPEVLADPAPVVFQTALNDFYVEYRLVCQASSDQPLPRAEVMSRLHANIQDAFNAAGVQIMSPHYLGDPAEPKLVPKERWDPK